MRLLALAATIVLFAASAEARNLKGYGPTTVAAGYGAAWVGYGDGRLIRVDADTLRSRRQPLKTGYISSVATGFGSIWFASGGSAVHRIDPRTGRIRYLPGPWTPTLVAAGAGAVWVMDFKRRKLFRVDPHRNRITGATQVPGNVWGHLVAGDRGVWLATSPPGWITGPPGPRVVWRLDAETLELRRAFRLDCDATLVPSGRFLWVLDNCDGTLRQFDSRTRSWSERVRTTRRAYGMTKGFGAIWVSNGSTVYRIDPRRKSVAAGVHAPGQYLAAGGKVVWVLDVGNGRAGSLRRIDPETNRLVVPRLRLSVGE